MNGAPKTVITMNDICKEYQLGSERVPVLKNVSFSVEYGEFAAIVGQSGSGKSTLLNIIGCLDKPTTGNYQLKGKEVGALKEYELAEIRNRDIGFVFQNFNLLPKLDVFGNVELPLIYANVPRKERHDRVKAILKRFGLYDRKHHKPNEISGGQKQRVAIARALVKKPSIILADEPTGNLDSTTTEEILTLFHEVHQEGNSIILITHEHDVSRRAQRIWTLVDGCFR